MRHNKQIILHNKQIILNNSTMVGRPSGLKGVVILLMVAPVVGMRTIIAGTGEGMVGVGTLGEAAVGVGIVGEAAAVATVGEAVGVVGTGTGPSLGTGEGTGTGDL